MSLEFVLCVFILLMVRVECFGGSISTFHVILKVDSIQNESLQNIKKGEIVVACP